jgi:hypothetical protein
MEVSYWDVSSLDRGLKEGGGGCRESDAEIDDGVAEIRLRISAIAIAAVVLLWTD